jgi:hypothetical protein
VGRAQLFVHLMDGEGTFGTPRRHNGDVGGKVTMWAVSLTWMNTSSLLLLMVRTKASERVQSSGFRPSGDVYACVSFQRH